MYDPTVGRFLSEDPLGPDYSENLSRYVGNSPASYTDPSGLLAPAAPALAPAATVALGPAAGVVIVGAGATVGAWYVGGWAGGKIGNWLYDDPSLAQPIPGKSTGMQKDPDDAYHCCRFDCGRFEVEVTMKAWAPCASSVTRWDGGEKLCCELALDYPGKCKGGDFVWPNR